MRIIALCGRAGSGKSTAAGWLQEELDRTEAGCVRMSFAEPVKRLCMDIFQLSEAQCFGNIAEKEAIDPRWGYSARYISQVFGTNVARQIHPDVWVRLLFRNWEASLVPGKPVPALVIDDLRFQNEAEAVAGWGGTVVQIRRPAAEGRLPGHVSETLPGVQPHRVIRNDGDLATFRGRIMGLVAR